MAISGSLIVGLALMVGAIFLQIHLSKKENKWFGLILPIISFLFSLVVILNMAAYTEGKLTLQEILPDGTVVEKVVEETSKPITDVGSFVIQVIYTFIICNIPTAILMLIYFSCRQKFKKSKEIDKMNIQDLE